MGSFSWLFADTNNTKNLRANRRGYVACPDGTFICEPCYETYGIFDGKLPARRPVSAMRNFLRVNGTLNRDSVSTVLRGISDGRAA